MNTSIVAMRNRKPREGKLSLGAGAWTDGAGTTAEFPKSAAARRASTARSRAAAIAHPVLHDAMHIAAGTAGLANGG